MIRTTSRFALGLLLPFAALNLPAPAAHGQIVLPNQFQETVVVNRFRRPTDFAFLPSGRILLAEKEGFLYLLDPTTGTTYPNPVLTLAVENTFDDGLQSVLVDPDFEQYPYIYVLYTTPELINRIKRFRITDDPGFEGVQVDDERDLIPAGWSTTGWIHAGGGLAFGLDGYLYISTGEGGSGANAQRPDLYGGKLLRVTRSGAAAPGNPFLGDSAYRPEIYCLGLRNPFK